MSLRERRLIGTVGYMGGVIATLEEFTWAWGNLIAFSKDALCQPETEDIHWDRARLSLHDCARNELLSRMRGDWILMLDTDMAFEPDFAARMVGTMLQWDLDVLTGIYSYKKAPHFPILYFYNPETEKHEIICDWDKTCDITRVSSAGAGCLLIRRRAVEKIVNELNENPFDRIGAKGEDHSFFIRCRKVGIEVWCAWKVEAQHLTVWGLSPSKDYIQVEGERQFQTEACRVA